MTEGQLDDDRPATLDELERVVRAVAFEIADRAMSEGARAVILTGSQARPHPPPESDIDLYAIGRGPRYRLEAVRGRLVSVSWRDLAESREAFDDPEAVGAFVPGWRRAVIVADPDGVAAELQRAALAWSWSDIGDERLDAWVAEEVTGFAEEVHKLVAARRAGDASTAAVQRSVLALSLAPRLTVHLRWLYESENGLWERVGQRMGTAWVAAQRGALGLDGGSLETSLDAAVDLFALAAAAVWPAMDERQRAVCIGALTLAGRPAPR